MSEAELLQAILGGLFFFALVNGFVVGRSLP